MSNGANQAGEAIEISEAEHEFSDVMTDEALDSLETRSFGWICVFPTR